MIQQKIYAFLFNGEAYGNRHDHFLNGIETDILPFPGAEPGKTYTPEEIYGKIWQYFSPSTKKWEWDEQRNKPSAKFQTRVAYRLNQPDTLQEGAETFQCKGCLHTLPIDFCIRTEGYCYLCDPNVTVAELLKDYDKRFRP